MSDTATNLQAPEVVKDPPTQDTKPTVLDVLKHKKERALECIEDDKKAIATLDNLIALVEQNPVCEVYHNLMLSL